ncbi:unnamed protein product [Urochloa humidicola]
MEEVGFVKGLLSVLVKPTLDSVAYWIQLMRGKHTSTEEMKREAELLEAARWDTYNCRRSSYLLKKARDQAEDLHVEIEAILDIVKQLSRYDHPSSPFSFCLKYSHNIWHTPSLWKTANKMAKLRSKISPLLHIIALFVNKDEDPTGKARLQNSHVASILPGADFVGMDKSVASLLKYLKTGENRRKVAIVVGMHGAGKTTLVRHVYENITVRGHFNCHAWVPIDSSFETKDILKSIIRRLYGEANLDTPKGINQMEDDMLGSVIRRFLEKETRRYVIVLDHISTRAQLKAILDLALPDKNYENFGRIIVTSRNLDVTRACNDAYKVDVEQLSATEVWELFCKKAFSTAELRLGLEVGKLHERIIGLCSGLPLAIDLLGGLLSKIPQSQWSSIIDGLEEHGYTEILEKSIIDLSDMAKTNIKNCLMYFSIFPKGSTVTHNKLVRLWIAEGFIHAQGRTQEEIATEYLNILIERHIVQVAEHYQYGRPKSYKLNGLMHDEIRKKAEVDNFCTTMESLSNSSEHIRRLSVQVTVKEFPRNVYLHKAISLFISSRTSHISKLLSSTRSLKILSLTDEAIQAFPKEISRLIHLRYLNLGNNKITKLPASVGNLIYLQTLIMKGTLVSELPKAILKLRQLQHLLAYRYDIEKKTNRQPDIIYGVEVPKGIGDLKELKTLSNIEANKDRRTIKELHKLKKLKRLGIIKLKGDDGPDLCTAVSEMGQLSSISLTSSDDEPINLENMLTIPPNLERLYLRGRLKVSANLFPSLQSLVRLRLVRSTLGDNLFNELQKLPKLAELALIQALDAEELNFRQDGFPNLKILDLDQLNRLVEMKVQGSLRNLCKLIIRNCSRLTSVPQGIGHLKELKELHLFDMPESFLLKIQKGNENYESVRHIEVICYYKEGFPQVKTEPYDAGSTSYFTAEEEDDHGISILTNFP